MRDTCKRCSGERRDGEDWHPAMGHVDAETCCNRLSERVEEMEQQINAKYWEGIRDDNTKLRNRLATAERELAEARRAVTARAEELLRGAVALKAANDELLEDKRALSDLRERARRETNALRASRDRAVEALRVAREIVDSLVPPAPSLAPAPRWAAVPVDVWARLCAALRAAAEPGSEQNTTDGAETRGEG